MPVYLSAVALPAPYRHTILTLAVVYPQHGQTPVIILAPSFPQLTHTMPSLFVSAVPSPHFIQIPRQIFLRFICLPVRLTSRYRSCRSFRAIALRNPALYAYLPAAFTTAEYRLTDYS